MPTIELDDHQWELGALIASGGFATVYEATDESGRSAAIKLIPKSPGTSRDLLFSDLDAAHDAPNVVPVFDRGETETHWAIAMPVAAETLRDALAEGMMPFEEAKPILLSVLRALSALDGKVVHRDLKPDNIFLVEGEWCLGDFGIARYAEATTASDTQKFSMTPPYAAPEQWRLERASAATDIYAFGIVVFEMLAGARPFAGPSVDDYRDQHLHQAAPPLPTYDAGLAALVADCLVKAPQARPSASRLLERLERLGALPSTGSEERLRAANLRIASEKSAVAARIEEERSEADRRRELFEAAKVALGRLFTDVRARITAAAPHTESTAGGWPFEITPAGWPLSLGAATLRISPPSPTPANTWAHYPPLFDVVAHAQLELTMPEDRWGYIGRACSLWYCDAVRAGEYRWYEVAFMRSPLMAATTRGDPIALDPGTDSGVALSNVTGGWQLAWPFTPIDQGDGEDFIGRWMGWFADAAAGNLHRPSHMPESDHSVLRSSYRRTQ